MFGLLILRRISDPGGTPGISSDIAVTVPATTFPITVDHLGDTGGTNGNVSALDDRLFAAHIRNGRLWTAHNIAVASTGVASGGAQRRNAVRWFQPDRSARLGDADREPVRHDLRFGRHGRHRAPVLYSIRHRVRAGARRLRLQHGRHALAHRRHDDWTPRRRRAWHDRRRRDLHSKQQHLQPPAHPGGGTGRRWGTYSFTSVDPNNDMTISTIQEFANATNSYGVRVAKLLAAAGHALVSRPVVRSTRLASTIVTVSGTAGAGSGFFDPVPGLRTASPRQYSDVTVNSVTYINPTPSPSTSPPWQRPPSQNVTITNPDGQSLTGDSIFTQAAPSRWRRRRHPGGGRSSGHAVNVTAAAPACAWTASTAASWNSFGTGSGWGTA